MEEADIMKNKVNKLISNLYKKREKLLDMDYSTGELAKELGTTPKYIRQSLIICRGAPSRRDSSGRLWINGRDLRKWLDEFFYAKTADKPAELSENEFYCVKCRARRIADSYVIDINRKGTEFKKAYCPVCGTRMNKYQKAEDK